jgi:hypothetical protein
MASDEGNPEVSGLSGDLKTKRRANRTRMIRM